MKFKVIKQANNDYNIIQKKFISESSNSDTLFQTYKDIIFSYKSILLAYEDDKCIGFLNFKTDIYNAYISVIYVDPTMRDYGIEEAMIRALENYTNKNISIIIRKTYDYAQSLLKKLGFFVSEIKNKKLSDLFLYYTKDYMKHIPFTKIIVNINAIYDESSKEYNAIKKILKTYGVKPSKLNILTCLRSVEGAIDDYNNDKITADELYKVKYQRYFKPLGIKIDPLLCYRIHNSAKTKYKNGAKYFLKTIGKRKHIFILSSIPEDDLKGIKNELKIQNVTKYVSFKEIDYKAIKEFSDTLRYRNIEEICYIDSSSIDPSILQTNIETIKVSSNIYTDDRYLFNKTFTNFKDLSKYIRKK